MASTYDPVATFNDLISGIDCAILTTVRPDGTLHSCPMSAQPADANGVLWFLTSSNTEKVEALRTQQRMNLAYADPARQRYVSVSGFCELVRDGVRAHQLWNPNYKTWLPGGVEDPNLILLKVNVQQVEYWDGQQNGMVEMRGFVKPVLG